MSITSVQKTWILVGILVIAGGAAFVYFDPLDLDLLGLKKSSPIVVQPAQKKASVAVPLPTPSPAPAATLPAAAPKATVVPTQAQAPVVAPPAVPAVAPSQAAPVSVAAHGPTVKPAMKSAPVKPERPKNQDLRHCLELESDAAIAKCAGE